jgi:hypothetical protein
VEIKADEITEILKRQLAGYEKASSSTSGTTSSAWR